jgi:two-component system response regulator HydG
MTARVLFVDDDRIMCESVVLALQKRGMDAQFRTSADEAFEAVTTGELDVVVTDLNMRGPSGIDLCQRIVALRSDLPVVLVTAFGSLETAIASIRAGAFDFITKPFEMEELIVTIERATQHRHLMGEVRRLRRAIDATEGFGEIVGTSPIMKRVLDVVARVAESDATVLVTGESGTGKELVARALHDRSRRSGGPFVAVNCAAMPEGLLESELFGHVRGAFTDARGAKRGLFLEAHKGTLFLDEIGELPLALQPKLLRALEQRSVRPVGGNAEVGFDARIVAATNRDLESAVLEKRFREDLFYRINVVHIELPPLRARGSDVLALAQHFLNRFAQRTNKPIRGISSAVGQKLVAYAWPGNVRELQNCIERAVALARYDELTVDDLPEKIRDYKPNQVLVVADDPSELVPLEEVERRYILRVLDAVNGNKSSAARILGLDRTTLYRRLERYGRAGDPDGG